MKFEYILCVVIVILLSIGLGSCRKDAKKLAAEKIVAEWIGKEIIFPEGMQCTFMGRDTVCPEQNTPNKIFLYIDSTGCTSCKLNFYEWKNLISEVDSTLKDKVSFIFYFHPKNEKELKFLLRREDFKHPVYLDKDNRINKINGLPAIGSYQCFLLDKDNKVLLIGNPAINPKIWELYKQSFSGGNGIVQNNISTTIEVKEAEIEIKNAKIYKPSIATFTIKNTGDVPLLISHISASCGCTVPEWDKRPVKPGEMTEVRVKVTPDHAGYLRKTVNVLCNTEKGVIPLVVKSTVKE